MSKKGQKKGVVVSVLNMKGGVGKTTVSAHVFAQLFAQLAKSTVLIDFDPQFNLTQQLIAEDVYEEYKSNSRTILPVLEDAPSTSMFSTNSSLGPPPPVEDVEVALRYLVAKPEIKLHLVPGDFAMTRYTLMNDPDLLAPAQDRFLKFIDETRQKRDVICIDCNPSSSFMTVCALSAATHVLVPVRPDRFSLQGLRLLSQYIAERLPSKPKMLVLLNGIKRTGYDPDVENQLRSDPDFGPLTLANPLYVSRVLEASQSYTGFAGEKRHSWRILPNISAIVDELKTALGLT